MKGSEFANLSKVSFSFATTGVLVEFTNDTKGKTTAELVGKKILFGVSLLVLPFIAIIEGVVRGIFAVPALFGLLIPEGKCRDWYVQHLFKPLMIGSLVCFSAAPGIFAVNYFNITKKEIEEKDIDKAFYLLNKLLIDRGINDLIPSAPAYSCCKPKNVLPSYGNGS